MSMGMGDLSPPPSGLTPLWPMHGFPQLMASGLDAGRDDSSSLLGLDTRNLTMHQMSIQTTQNRLAFSFFLLSGESKGEVGMGRLGGEHNRGARCVVPK